MSRSLRALVAFSLLLQLFAIPVADVLADQAENAQAITDALESVAEQLDRLAGFQELGDALPLTGLDPGAEDALRLADLFEDSLKSALDGMAVTSYSQLAGLIDGADGTYGGVQVTFSGPDAGPGDAVVVEGQAFSSLVDVQFEVMASRSVDVPLDFDAEAVQLAGGGLTVDFALFTVLEFQYDPGADNPALAFYLVDDEPGNPPSIKVSATADGGFGTITANLGFTEVTAGGNIVLNTMINIPFDDPDDDQAITLIELASSALEDLVGEMAFVEDPATYAVNASFDLDSALVPGTPDGTITFVDPDISPAGGGLDASPTLSGLGNLADFRNFTAADALGALGRLVVYLNGLQSTGRLDVELPLLSSTFSDILAITEVLSDTVASLRQVDNPLTPLNEANDPTFDDAQEMIDDLEVALGTGDISLQYLPGNPIQNIPSRLVFPLSLQGSDSKSVPMDFRGELDVLSEINVTTEGSTNLYAGYELNLNVGLDLTAQPVEDGAGIGSCEDGIDNGGGDNVDAADPDCASLRTLEERIFLDVGTAPGTPEVVAHLGLDASGVGARANIGLLEAGISDAHFRIGSNKSEDGGAPGTCSDGMDNGGGDGADAADPECTFVTFDFSDSGDGRLTIRDLFNTIGIDPPEGAALAMEMSAKVDGEVPVTAELAGSSLGTASIVVSGDYDGPLTDALTLVNNISFDGSGLQAADFFDFSPCSNDKDDDGDGVVNDGCPGASNPEALNDPESESRALLDKILALVQALAGQLDSMEGASIGSSLSDPLPLVGKSFKDLFSYADGLQDLADDLAQWVQPAGEDPDTECANDIDDDHDGVINDGCPIWPSAPPSMAETGAQCFNDTDDDDNNPDEPGGPYLDGRINDGCPRVGPSLQALTDLIQRRLEAVLESIPGTDDDLTSATAAIYLDADKDLRFALGADVGLTADTTFNLDLGGLGGSLAGVELVGLETEGSLSATVQASMDLDFGLKLDQFQPFIMGSSGLNISASADADDLVFQVSIGPLTGGVGTDTPVPETACGLGDNVDDDIDGWVNDGCAPQGSPEEGSQCRNNVDDDGDTIADDGCPAVPQVGDDPEATCGDGLDNDDDGTVDDGCPAIPEETRAEDICDDALDNDGDGYINDGCFYPDGFADKGRAHLGARFEVDVDGANDAKILLADLSFNGDFAGTEQADCPTTTDHACAVLPLYLGAVELEPIATPPDHQITVSMSDITDPGTLALTMPDVSKLEDLIAAQMLDLLLLESGLGRFLEVVKSVLNGEIFGFKLPLIGDQLDEAANFVDDLSTNLVAGVHRDANPLADLSTAEVLQDAVNSFSGEVGTVLNDAGILLDTNGTDGVTSADFVASVWCEDSINCGIGPETGDMCALGDDVDDDGDGWTNDGCDAQGSPEEGSQCRNNVDDDGDTIADDGCPAVAQVGDDPETTCGDGLDNDTDGTVDDGCPAIPEETRAEDICDDELDNDGDGYINDGCAEKQLSATDVDEVHFRAKLGQSVDIPIGSAFDIGIPGLGLSSSDSVNLEPYWSVDVGFGISKNSGFFLLTQEAVGDPETGEECTANFADDDDDGVPNDGCPELSLGADVTLPSELEAQLGFLLIKVVDGDPEFACDAAHPSSGEEPCRPGGDEADSASTFGPKFVVDLKDPGTGDAADGRFTFGEMSSAPSFGNIVAYDFAAEANINLHLETSIAGISALPKLIADLKIDWRWSLNGETSGGALAADSLLNNPCDTESETNCFSIALDDVVIDAGTFLSKFLAPVVKDVQQYTKPLQPIIDVLNAPIPVLSDLSGEPVTLLTLCETLCPPEYKSIEMIIYIVQMVSFINGLELDTAGGDLTIALTTEPFVLNAPRLQSGTLAASDARLAFTDQAQLDGLQPKADALGSTARGGQPLSNGEVQDTGGLKSIGLSFPFLDQPSQLMMMLFGQDVDLILWEPPGLEAGFSYSMKFGPIWSVPPVYLEVGGSVSIKGRIGIGYDTEGLRQVLFEGADAASLLNGLYLTDRNAQGQDVPELELRGEIFANAQVSVLIFSAGAGGSVYLTIGIDLQDPNQNGKLKFREVADILEATSNPFCLFRLVGEFGVRIFVFAEVDLFFWSKRWEKTLADIVLLKFTVECELEKEPILAKELAGGVLRLNMGPHSDDRGSGSVGYNVTAEEFRVTQEGDGSLTVVAFGYSQNYCAPGKLDGPPPCGGWNKVVADADDSVDADKDEDVISLLDGAKGAETKCANGDAVDDDNDGFVNDGCPAGGDPPTVEKGGQCSNSTDDDEDGLVNDGCPTVGELVPFTIQAELKGGRGNDQITGGGGDDVIDGGSGDDLIVARAGADEITGGAGKDQVNAGPGSDIVYGDQAAGGAIAWDGCDATGNAPENGDDGNDSIEADLGADKVCGQGGDDTLIGGISPTPAKDAAESGTQCDDELDNDEDGAVNDGCVDLGDEIHGGTGEDDIEGGDGNDKLYGDADPDRIDGAKGADELYGGNETPVDETSRGDVLIGGPGSDKLRGNDGHDTLIGGNVLAGEPDEGDDLDGGAHNDKMAGDNATWDGTALTPIDASIGGSDLMVGGSGTDNMFGQIGDDDMFGGDQGDVMEGNAGEDYMFGDSGPADPRDQVSINVVDGPNDGSDVMRGDEGIDHMYGGGAGDTMRGDDGDDYMEGNGGGDTMRGVKGSDQMFGNDGTDTMYGDSSVDEIVGGSETDEPDGGDVIFGNAGEDVIVGDNGFVEPGGGDVQTLGTTNGGTDTIWGQGEDDVILGGIAGDVIWGNWGSDIILGDNGWVIRAATVVQRIQSWDPCAGGHDIIDGSQDDDVLIGGNDGDDIAGRDGNDIILGDNGVVVRTDGVSPDNNDVFTTNPNCGGSDTIEGNDGNDIILGGSGGDDSDGVYLGGDTITGHTGQDLILGDNGWVKRDASDVVERITSIDASFGGEDNIAGNEAEDIILGGNEDDDITGDEADDIILGDNGVVVRTDPENPDDNDIFSIEPEFGGADTIEGNDGHDLIIGGSGGSDLEGTPDGGDEIYGQDGEDIVLGDNGYVTRDESDVVLRIDSSSESSFPCYGGQDYIEGNELDDILIGGNEDDDIYGHTGDDTILGDNGVVVRSDGSVQENDVFTSDPDCGGADTIEGNEGNDLILGGSGGSDLEGIPDGGDDISGHLGQDIVLGDNGYVTRDTSDIAERIESREPSFGGQDEIYGNEEEDILVGGNEDDFLAGNDGPDTILGDNGTVVRTDGSGQDNDVFTHDPDDGGSDTISGDQGADVILGGSGGSDSVGTGSGDTITGDTEDDVILGDNGYVTRDEFDTVQDAYTAYETEGGRDTISGNEHDDIILGGQENDILSGNGGDDYILGDNGEFDNRANDPDLATLDVINSTYPNDGGDDIISGGPGDDIVFGGTAHDVIDGNENHDILLGDHGSWDSARPFNQQHLSIFTGTGDGGDWDTIHGNDGDDFILGQQGDDLLYGDLDQDDMSGGHNVELGADGSDEMYGESDSSNGGADTPGADVMIGDNGVISRTLDAGSSWVINPWSDDYGRVVQLYDVERVGAPVDTSVYGNDLMYGNDNDDIMYGQNGMDEMYGGAGDDDMEGNAQSDYMEGNGEDDDMLGGSGPTTSDDPATRCTGCTDTSTLFRSVTLGGTVDAPISVYVPFGDEMYGDDGSDVMLGDNGIISRPIDASEEWITLSYALFADSIGGSVPRHPTGGTGARIDREVEMVEVDAGPTAGSDLMFGGPGDDDMYGQFDDTAAFPGSAIGDEMYGDEGEDAMVGDNGIIDNWVVVSPTQWIEPPEPFIDDHIFIEGTLFREVTLQELPEGGDDRIRGGEDGDWMHGGAGNDLMNGNSGNDRMHGDDNDDVMWGGPNHDHLWGGYHFDYLDVRPRPDDLAEWHEYGGVDHYQDVDYVYGGWDQDAMQANVGDEGPVVGDRLIDWVGTYNVFYLCPGLYGEFVATRDLSPAMIGFLQDLSAGDGAVDTKTPGTSGFDEVAMVFSNQAGQNSHPVHPDNPGHFVCDEYPLEPTVRSLAIDLSSTVKKETANISGEVLVVDQYDEVVEGAVVYATWTLPDSTPESQTATTNKKGIASFSTSGGVGVYTLTIDDIVLDGYTFDADNSQLSAWIDALTGTTGMGDTGDVERTERVYLPVVLRR